jgi:hypothetical protein
VGGDMRHHHDDPPPETSGEGKEEPCRGACTWGWGGGGVGMGATPFRRLWSLPPSPPPPHPILAPHPPSTHPTHTCTKHLPPQTQTQTRTSYLTPRHAGGVRQRRLLRCRTCYVARSPSSTICCGPCGGCRVHERWGHAPWPSVSRRLLLVPRADRLELQGVLEAVHPGCPLTAPPGVPGSPLHRTTHTHTHSTPHSTHWH